LIRNNEDDGNDLADFSISDDGEVVACALGHTPNSMRWITNPASERL
jgi:hypothetical protein